MQKYNVIKKYTLVPMLILVFCFSLLLVACENPNKTPQDVKIRYEKLINTYSQNDTFLFGTKDSERGSTIVVQYNNPELASKIKSDFAYDNLHLRYRSLETIQANILKYTFRYFEVWKDSFYNLENYNQKEINKLYKSIDVLDNHLNTFNQKKLEFERDFERLGDNVAMIQAVNKFTFEYNKLIEASFDFIDGFKSFHIKHIAPTDNHSLNSAQRILDEGYLMVAKYVYYENILPLNFYTGTFGICDQINIMHNNMSTYVITNALQLPVRVLGDYITAKLCETEIDDELTNKLTNILYTANSFKQAFEVYMSNYNLLDNATLLRVKLELVDGMTLNDYVNNLSTKKRICYNQRAVMLLDVFANYKQIINELLN